MIATEAVGHVEQPLAMLPKTVRGSCTRPAWRCSASSTSAARVRARGRGSAWSRSRPARTAGGAGSAALQLGVQRGAHVFATAGSKDKLDLCRELGAERVINYRDEDFVDAVLDATDGRGVDVAFDAVSGDVTLQTFRRRALTPPTTEPASATRRCGGVLTQVRSRGAT
jgi:hypothetical protein